MKVIRNHYHTRPTILINDRIINGCQDFTINESKKVYAFYGVSSAQRQDVADVYTGVSTDEEIQSFINDDDWRVRLAIAMHGNEQHKSQLQHDHIKCIRVASLKKVEK